MAEQITSRPNRRRVLAGITLVCSALAVSPSGVDARTPPAEPPTEASETEADAAQNEDRLLHSCPIDGPATFEDSWGWARSGGRSHQGVDMIAERGIRVIAVRDGDVNFKNNRLGGNAVWLETDNGDRFYYAHLDSWEGESRRVEAGDVIGYVGSTGNAGGPHLHFETHPDGGVENPFVHTLAACVAPSSEASNDRTVWETFI